MCTTALLYFLSIFDQVVLCAQAMLARTDVTRHSTISWAYLVPCLSNG